MTSRCLCLICCESERHLHGVELGGRLLSRAMFAGIIEPSLADTSAVTWAESVNVQLRGSGMLGRGTMGNRSSPQLSDLGGFVAVQVTEV